MMEPRERPMGWASTTIANVVAYDGVFTDGDWVESKDQDPSGDVRLIQLADVGDGHFVNKSSRFLTRAKSQELRCTFLQRGDLLIARMPDPLGRCCIFPLDGAEAFVTVVDVCAVRLGASPVALKYLMYVMNSPRTRAAIASLQSGSTRKRISRKNLATVTFPLAPLNEQHRIVAKIEELFSELDKGVESLKKAREQLKVYRQAVLKHAFEGKLTAQWREENKDKLETPKQLLARIQQEREAHYEQQIEEWKAAVRAWEESGQPGKKPRRPPKPLSNVEPTTVVEKTASSLSSAGWAIATLDEVTEVNPQLPEKWAFADNPLVSFVPMSAVEAGTGTIDVSQTRYILDVRKGYTSFLEGDVLFAKITPCMENGKIAIVPPLTNDVGFGSTEFHVLRPFPAISEKFIYYFVSSKQFRSDAQHNMTGAVGQRRVPAPYLAKQSIPIPSSREQIQIASMVEKRLLHSDEMLKTIDAQIDRARIARQSILKKAFSGQLVPQDPNDEPASKLLERVKAEKAASVQNSNSPKKRPRAKATA